MKTRYILAGLLVLFLIIGCAKPAAVDQSEKSSPLQGAATDASKNEVSAAEEDTLVPIEGDVSILGNQGFNPTEVTISAGDELVWVNEDPQGKSVVLTFQKELNGRTFLVSSLIKIGETFSNIFYDAGTYTYWTVGNGVKGTIIVQE